MSENKTAEQILKDHVGGIGMFPHGTSMDTINAYREAIIAAMEEYRNTTATAEKKGSLQRDLMKLEDDELITLCHLLMDSPKLGKDARVSREEVEQSIDKIHHGRRKIIIELTLRCWVGTIELHKNGDVFVKDEEGGLQPVENQLQVANFLLSESLVKEQATLTGETAEKEQCPEFPHFGAHYPDATCIDGYLWDLDKYEDGKLYGGGEDPCPFCNTEAYLEWANAGEDDGPTREQVLNYIQKLRDKYGK